MAEPDQTLRQQSKATPRRRIYQKSDSIVKETPNGTDRLVDEMAATAIVPPQETNKDFADAIFIYCKPKDVTCPKSFIAIFDTYNNTSVKQPTQIRRGQPSLRVYITSMMQKIPKRRDRNNIFNNEENKSELAKVIID